MKFTRRKRIAFELLGPAALGAGIIVAIIGGAALRDALVIGLTYDDLRQIGMLSLTFLGAAYVVAGAQSIIYTFVLEWRFKKGLNPHSWQMVRLSSLLGFASGAVVSLGHFQRPTKMGLTLLVAGGLGLVVGFLMGLLIRRWSKEQTQAGENLP